MSAEAAIQAGHNGWAAVQGQTPAIPPAPGSAPADFEAYKANRDAEGAAKAQAARDAALVARATQELFAMEARELATLTLQDQRNPRVPLTLLTDEDLLARPDPEWWIDGIIPKDSEVMLAAPGGIGKTFLAIHFARAMASGLMVCRRETKAARTLYVVAEGASAFGKRARAWNTYFTGWNVPQGSIQYLERGVNLSLPNSVDELREVFRAGDFDILVIDTLSQLSGLEDENSPAKVAQVINAIRSIREVKAGASSIIIHHTDARATKARGASSMRDNVDALWMLKEDSGGGFSMSSRNSDGGKMKDAEPEKLSGFKLVDHGGSAVVSWSGKEADSPYWPSIRDAIADGEWHLGSAIRGACGVTDTAGAEYEAWKKYMALLVKADTLEKEGATRNTKYRMPPIPGG